MTIRLYLLQMYSMGSGVQDTLTPILMFMSMISGKEGRTEDGLEKHRIILARLKDRDMLNRNGPKALTVLTEDLS